MKNLFFSIFFLSFLLPLSWAQEAQIGASKETIQRAISLCPEVAKLTEAIALSRDIGHSIEWTTTFIQDSILPKANEVQLIQDMVTYVYMHPEMTPYEHYKKAEPACYDYFGIPTHEIKMPN